MPDYKKIREVIDNSNPTTIEEFLRKDSYVIRYFLGVYDLDSFMRVLNLAIMTYLTSDDFFECIDEKKKNCAKILPDLMNDLTEVSIYIKDTQEHYEKCLDYGDVKTCCL